MLIYSKLYFWAKTQPNKICLIHSSTKLTYGELVQKIDAAAHSLACVAKKGEKAIIKHPDPIMQLIFLLGASKAGVVSIITDTSLPDEYFRALTANVNPTVCIDDKYLLHNGNSGCLPEVTEEDLFLGALSSGSTGSPKLIWRDHQSWVRAFPFQSSVFKIGSSDRLFLTGLLTYSANLNSCLHLLNEGGTVIISNSKNPFSWVKEIIEHNISSIFMVPANYRLITRVSNIPLSQIKSLVSAGSKIDMKTVRSLISYFPNAHICEYYGASELGHVSYSNTEDLLMYPESVGKAFPNVKIEIKDDLIHVQSPYLAPDYRPQATIGDMGAIDDRGYLHLLGRKNTIINSSGLKIMPEQVEAVINRCPGVSASIVKGIEDSIRGQKVAAWVVKSDSTRTVKDIRTYCQKYLPRNYCPHQIKFINELPLNSCGKISRHKLK